MSRQFEFRLIGVDAPDGELEADHLIAIVQSLKEVATKVGRVETDAEAVGRPPNRTRRVAGLTVGLASGSTRVLARRAGGGALDFDLDDERAFDEKFQAIAEAIGADVRPSWVNDPLASAADSLRVALHRAARRVEFAADGRVRASFETAETHRETWASREAGPDRDAVTFVGRLRAVNLDTQRLQVTDDMGFKVALPNVLNAPDVGRLLDNYVAVVGVPDHDHRGRVSQIRDATISEAAPAPATGGVRKSVNLDSILASAAGPSHGGIPELSDAEAHEFLKAIGP